MTVGCMASHKRSKRGIKPKTETVIYFSLPILDVVAALSFPFVGFVPSRDSTSNTLYWNAYTLNEGTTDTPLDNNIVSLGEGEC